MTRFARAKGSKSSNERAPEDSTPWEVMKEQLLQAKVNNEESKKRKEAEQQRIENYENFLKDHKVQKRKATWCDFPEVEKKKKPSDSTGPIESSAKPKKKNKKKNKVSSAGVSAEVGDCDSNAQPDTSETTEGTVKKPKKKKNKKSQPQEEKSIDSEIVEKSTDITENAEGGKKNKKKKNKQNKISEESTEAPKDNNTNSTENNENPKNKQTKSKNKKNKKLIDGKPVRRKEINDRSFQLIVNGKEIELVRFDGFPVMKKDAERLQELKTNMIKKGIPKSEVQRTMKLERRRAEKALARMKREVCYNCRKGGHVLSDCPELKSKIPGADTAEGVCFKCGSTEHRQFECKVQRDKEFRFATCFICKEPGHIARQCPDNPKGLYPNGGSCKLCGDVTHLRKDCPTVMDKKEESTVKLHTLDSSENIEDVGQQHNKVTPVESSKKPKKIKF
uniref:CCHC-type domain-containing protein n=1 Tax=Heliothis virescens TaxID=7102 RepID=A0A2A4JTS6_HELVI